MLTLYVPAEGSDLARTIDPASAIVGTPVLDWWKRQGEDPGDAEADRVVIDFEGNRYAAQNIVTLADRAVHAAGRHLQAYPTVARRTVHQDELVEVGEFHPEYERIEVTNARDMNLLRKWVFPELEVEAGFEALGRELRGTSPRAR